MKAKTKLSLVLLALVVGGVAVFAFGDQLKSWAGAALAAVLGFAGLGFMTASEKTKLLADATAAREEALQARDAFEQARARFEGVLAEVQARGAELDRLLTAFEARQARIDASLTAASHTIAQDARADAARAAARAVALDDAQPMPSLKSLLDGDEEATT